MTERNPRNIEIVRQLEVDANATAAAYLVDVNDFARQTRLKCMADLLEEFIEWMDERGDTERLEDAGVDVSEDDGLIELRQGKRKLELRASDDMSIAVDGKSMQPNPDCPILDDAFYVEVMRSIDAWLDGEAKKGTQRYFE